MGAWIETRVRQQFTQERIVAPLVGAWIETFAILIHVYCNMSHPSWVRGLKLVSVNNLLRNALSHPSWVRGLKLVLVLLVLLLAQVAPLVGAWIETRKKTWYLS